MKINTLFVGDVTTTLSDTAIEYDPTAIGIIDDLIVSDVNTAYVSAGDHTLDNFLHYLQIADELVYVTIRPGPLNDTTLFWLRYFSHTKVVRNLPEPNLIQPVPVVDSRKTESPQLWNVGCSFTIGHGINKNERWGQLLGKMLNLESSFLAADGSSVSWATNQILRADIRKGDVVAWGLTGAARMPYYGGDVTEHIPYNFLKHSSLKSLISEKFFATNHFVNSAIADVEAINNYAKKLGFKLVITQFPLNVNSDEIAILEHLSSLDNFVHSYSNGFVDYGSDGNHPGPKQNKIYADIFYNFITEGKHAHIS